MTDDELARAASTALKARFPEPDGVDLLDLPPARPSRRRTILAAAACVLAVAGVSIGLALTSNGEHGTIAGSGPTRSLTQPSSCKPSAADVTIRFGTPHLPRASAPVRTIVPVGSIVRIVATTSAHARAFPVSQSRDVSFICHVRLGSEYTSYFRAVHPGRAMITSGCSPCSAISYRAPITVIRASTVLDQLRRLGLQAAHAQGAVAQTITAVRSTHAHAVRVTMQAVVSGEQPVWVVQVKATHEFECRSCPGPPGSSVRGRYILFVVDASSLRGTDGGIDPGPAPLGKLGTVITLYSG